MLPSETSSKKLFDGPTCRLAIETTSRRLARMIWFLTASASSCSRSISVEVGGLGPGRVEPLAELVRLVLQVVHLAEQVRLLLAVQQRDFVEAGQVGGQTLGGLGPARGLAVGRLGHRGRGSRPRPRGRRSWRWR